MPPKKSAAKKFVKKPDPEPPTPLTIEEIMALKKPRVETETIQLDGEVAEEVERLKVALVTATQNDRSTNKPPQAPKVEKELQKVLDAARTTEAVFTFRSIGSDPFEKLMATCKPSRDQRTEGMVYNPETFGPKLIAAASVEPKIDLETAKSMFTTPDWNSAELTKLFMSAMHANTESPDIPLSSSAIGSTLNSISSLITQQVKESRSRSS